MTSHANHLALLVRPPGEASRWLVDVGFGGSLLEPLPLEEGRYHHAPFTVGLRRLADGHWQFWECLDDGEFTFDFEATVADEDALAVRSDYLQTSPDSGFVLNLVCQLRRPDSPLTLRGRVWSAAKRKGKNTRLLASADELVATLTSEFELDVPEAAMLWDRICERHEAILAED